MKLSGNCYLKNQCGNLDYLIEFTNLNGEQVSLLKKIGREGKKLKINLEIEESILDDAERRYLIDIIRPFEQEKILIMKHRSSLCNYEQITIDIRFVGFGQIINLPPFPKNTMYKGMKLNEKYTLKELGLWIIKLMIY